MLDTSEVRAYLGVTRPSVAKAVASDGCLAFLPAGRAVFQPHNQREAKKSDQQVSGSGAGLRATDGGAGEER